MKQDGFAVLFGVHADDIPEKKLQEQTLFDFPIEKPTVEKKLSDVVCSAVSEERSVRPIIQDNSEKATIVSQTFSDHVRSQKTFAYQPPVCSPQIAVQKKKKVDKSGFFAFFHNLGEKTRGHLLSGLKELKVVVMIFVVMFCGFYFFNNAQLVFYTFKDVFASVSAAELEKISDTLMHSAADANTADTMQALEERFALIQQEASSGEVISLGMEDFINAKERNHEIVYNILPPTNRLIIPDLNINVPLVDTEANGRIDFSDENFEDELMKGVVKYPTTPKPGSKGNTLLFGHTSTEWWKNNPYGVVFRNIPKLKAGQRFQVVWNGELTTYEMVERKVVLPKNVEEYYNLFADRGESYLTLMGCYPIGTADKRMMVVAKKVEN